MSDNPIHDGFRLDDEMLLDFAIGALGGIDAKRVAALVKADPDLSSRVARMQFILATLKADDSVAAPSEVIRRGLMVWSRAGFSLSSTRASICSWAAQTHRCIAELVFDSRTPLALAGYRTAGATATPDAPSDYQLAYTSPAGRVDLQVTNARQGWRLRGQVASADPVEVGAVTLLPIDGGQTVEAVADGSGQFRIDAESGRYDLLIELDHGLRAILAPDLEVGCE